MKAEGRGKKKISAQKRKLWFSKLPPWQWDKRMGGGGKIKGASRNEGSGSRLHSARKEEIEFKRKKRENFVLK